MNKLLALREVLSTLKNWHGITQAMIVKWGITWKQEYCKALAFMFTYIVPIPYF